MEAELESSLLPSAPSQFAPPYKRKPDFQKDH